LLSPPMSDKSKRATRPSSNSSSTSSAPRIPASLPPLKPLPPLLPPSNPRRPRHRPSSSHRPLLRCRMASTGPTLRPRRRPTMSKIWPSHSSAT
jgi:hypothetical protein